MEEEGKICPIQSDGVKKIRCETDDCQLWTEAYTIEGYVVFDCAFVINARKNSDGMIPV